MTPQSDNGYDDMSSLQINAKQRTTFRLIKDKQMKGDLRQPLAQGTILDRYKLVKVIGRGSFSLVYSAIEQTSGMQVAIKEYFPKYIAKRNKNKQVILICAHKQFAFGAGIRQFFQEALALHKMSHPNVLQGRSIFRENKTVYLVSANSGGRNLQWFLRSVNEPMDRDIIYKIFMPILSALKCLHDAKLLHLDIKPVNILLQPNSESLLIDFGAAQFFSRRTRISNMQTLTHGFAPPEQYDKAQILGSWTDIYAVAATLYFVISRKVPVKVNGGEAKAVPKLNPKQYTNTFDMQLIEAINRGLSYHPKNRFDNVDIFAAQILKGSKWRSLQEYEMDVLSYDRFGQLQKILKKCV